MRPVDSRCPVTLGYRQKPRNPALKNYIHRGVDYGCPAGTKVGASAAGTVVHVGRGGYGSAYGIQVIVKVADVWVLYAHLSAVDVRVGQKVTTGQLLGRSGATGNALGPHLHYQECTQKPAAYTSDRKPRLLDAPPSLAIVAKPGTWSVATDLLNARAYPVTGAVAKQLKRGAVLVTDARATVDGKTWVRIKSGGLWVRGDYLAAVTQLPPPAVPPATADDRITERTWNLGGYNDHGIRTWKARTAEIAREMLASDVDVWYVQELSAKAAAPMRAALDAAVGAKYARTKGTDGRYCYVRRSRFKLVASGAVVAIKTSWYRADDKQGSWFLADDLRLAGRQHSGLSVHLENEDATGRSQVKQALSMDASYRAKTRGVKNRTLGFDGNSENLVREALEDERGYITAGGPDAKRTMLGWDGAGDKRFDYLVHDLDADPRGYRTGGSTKQTDHLWVESNRRLTA